MKRGLKSQTQLGIDKRGGYVTAYKKDATLGVFMYIDEHGGDIGAFANDQERVK